MNGKPGLVAALARLNAGDDRGAFAAAEAALGDTPGDAQLLSLAGLLACRIGHPDIGAERLTAALAQTPDDRTTLRNLAAALTELARWDEVIALAAAAPDDPRLRRTTAYARQQTGDHAGAAADYRAALSAAPTDFESWNNLGNVLRDGGDTTGAVDALIEANRLRPDLTAIHLNLAHALSAVERHADARTIMRHAGTLRPKDATILHELGLAEAAMRDYPAAEKAWRRAIATGTTFAGSFVELGLLLENLNRIDELESLVSEAKARGVAADDIALIEAWALRRRDRFEEARAIASAIPASIAPLRRHHLLAGIADRLGDYDTAMAEFTAMNTIATEVMPPPPGTRDYLDEVVARTAALTRAAVATWSPPPPPDGLRAPVFVMGFPRSGTTLVDTLLMNDPRFHVVEELPVFAEVEAAADAIETFGPDDLGRLRRVYFDALKRILPAPAGTIVIDKYPLHMTRVPLIHRVFPDAKYVLLERHPCDVVLSCFMANFQLNRAMRHMTSLESAAELYDAAFAALSRARALLPVDVHALRYEHMVANLEGAMRPVLDFIGVSWNPDVLDNQTSAARRTHIRTASYSQVTEPIYRRAAGRWERYRGYLEPVLPVLAPWCERMGYAL